MPNIQKMNASALLFLICYVAAATTVKADPDIMKCFLCKILEETTENSSLPPAMQYAVMYKQCNQLGLIQSLCDQLVDQYAKTIVRLRRSKPQFTQNEICVKLRLCDA
ncbi:hypothetical protein M3Y97_00854700 [Aphelenchoides bicaudatus]|nr:hypothetical protein M3Y97_00854700 [Aphelenchoides bicaudatus]